jgi:hypothetical protein
LRYTDPTGNYLDEGCGMGENCELPDGSSDENGASDLPEEPLPDPEGGKSLEEKYEEIVSQLIEFTLNCGGVACAEFASQALHLLGYDYDYVEGIWSPTHCKDENASYIDPSWLFDYLTDDLGLGFKPIPLAPTQNVIVPKYSLIFYESRWDDPDFDKDKSFIHVSFSLGNDYYENEGFVLPTVVDYSAGAFQYPHSYLPQDVTVTYYSILVVVTFPNE